MNETNQLQRRLKLRHVVAIGIAYMSPFAVFDTFGIASNVSSGHVPAAYIVVFIAILFTALSYGNKRATTHSVSKTGLHPLDRHDEGMIGLMTR